MRFGVLIDIIGSHLSLLPERREMSPFSRGEMVPFGSNIPTFR